MFRKDQHLSFNYVVIIFYIVGEDQETVQLNEVLDVVHVIFLVHQVEIIDPIIPTPRKKILLTIPIQGYWK